MKKAFTLIELMVSLIVGLVLLNFVFTYQFNFLKELKYLEANNNLAMHNFKLSELIARGFKNDGDDTKGLICLKEFVDSKNINTTNLTSMELSNINDHGNFNAKIDDYTYKNLYSRDIKIKQVKYKNFSTLHTDGWIYAIEINSKYKSEFNDDLISNPKYMNYKRLVYTK